MSSEFPRSELTILTFVDSEGKSHIALPLYEILFREDTYSVALSSGAGLVVIQHVGEERVPVEDAELVQALSEQIHTLQEQGSEPVLHFQAENAEGSVARFRARGVVAHQGMPFIVAEAPDGSAHAFHAPNRAGDAPVLVSDAAEREWVLQYAESQSETSSSDAAPSHFTLRLPDGETRRLQPERSVQSDGNVYWLASDVEMEGRVYSLRQAQNGEWVAVTDVDEVERVRIALLQNG